MDATNCIECASKSGNHLAMATTTTATTAPPVPTDDRMPIHGIDHVELYVGNAAQAAYYFRSAFGFTETAYSGLETGRRDRVSHVLEQGRIRLVLTGTLLGGDDIAAHHAPPRRRRPQDRAERARRGGRVPARRGARRARHHDAALGRGRARPRAALLDRHLRRHPAPVRRSARATRARSCRATSARGEAAQNPPTTACSRSTTSSATSSSATWRSGCTTTSASSA